MIKIDIRKYLPVTIAAFIGTGIGICVGFWFRIPPHPVDVFAFVESAMGIGLTSHA